jgi:hypothetical protein
VLWATRRALALLDPGSDLEQVVVEELFPAEPNSDPNRLLGVDLTEYYGGNSMSNARRVVVTQLKYSERNPSRPLTAARLCDSSSRASVMQRLAEVFVDVAAGCDRSRVLDVLQIRLVSNRPVSPRLRARGELAERDARELLAIRLATPAYVTRELGERPDDPRLARAWDRGVTAIQGYRREREITDMTSALGERPKTGIDHAAQETAQRRVREVQRRLGLQQQLDRLESIERDMGFGR